MKEKIYSVRLDHETDQQLREMARRERKTRAELVRGLILSATIYKQPNTLTKAKE